MKRLLYWIVLVLPLLLLSTVPAQAQDTLPRFETVDCAFDLPPDQPVDCGFLIVPQNRKDAQNTATLRLPVAIFKSTSVNRQPDPIIYLAGGPGGNAMDGLPDAFTFSFAGFLNADRDFIMFDQRGVGLAQPSLDCPEYNDVALEMLPLDLTDAEMTKSANDALAACHERLVKQGLDVTAFNTSEDAADVADLRTALGYDQVNLLGISYGTRLALTVMHDHPEGIRSVILDSVFPPQINGAVNGSYVADRLFQTLFKGCEQDATCNSAYPNLQQVLLDTAHKLDEEPVTFAVKIPPTNKSYDLLLNGPGFVGGIYQLFYLSSVIPQVPQIIYDASRGNFDYLSYLYGFLLEDSLTEGVYYATSCQEDYPFTTIDQVIADAKQYPALGDYLNSKDFVAERANFGLCKLYYPGTGDPATKLPVTSDIPTLVMSAEYDPVTPPAWGEEAAKTLRNSYVFEYPGLGHGVTPADDCPQSMAVNFVQNPGQKPDDSCIAQMSAPQWVVPEPLGAVNMTAFADATLAISSVAPEGWLPAGPDQPGVFLVGSNNPAQFAFRVPEDGLEGYFQRIVIGGYGYSEVPAPTGTVTTDAGTWTIYQIEGQGVFTTLATTTIDDQAYVVAAVAGSPDERQQLYDAALIPALEAFAVTA